jgi:hypothetical protein
MTTSSFGTLKEMIASFLGHAQGNDHRRFLTSTKGDLLQVRVTSHIDLPSIKYMHWPTKHHVYAIKHLG